MHMCVIFILAVLAGAWYILGGALTLPAVAVTIGWYAFGIVGAALLLAWFISPAENKGGWIWD